MYTNYYYQQGSTPDLSVSGEQNKWYVTREVSEFGRRLDVSIVAVVETERESKAMARDLQKRHLAAVALGKAGGASTSDAKRAASADNGKRGGRPRKSVE